MQVAIAYIRVSTNEQASSGVSLPAQRAKIAAWAKTNGMPLASVHVDAGLSGAKAENRPALQAAIAAACKQKAALVVYSLSRLARSTRDAIAISDKLEKAGADLVSLTEKIDTTSAAGRLFFSVIAAFAQFERDVISERTRFGMEHLRAQGMRVSRHVPFGFDLAGDFATLLPNAHEQHVIRQMKKWRGNGLSLRAIADRLHKRGHKPKRGATWLPGTIRGILKRAVA
ncbi:MAG TPA: recombinase family protein [Planctomycetota bacterium]